MLTTFGNTNLLSEVFSSFFSMFDILQTLKIFFYFLF